MKDAPDGEPAEVFRVVEVADLDLEDLVRVALRRGDVFEDGVEQRAQVLGVVLQIVFRDAVARDGVDHREIELVLGGVEVDE